MVVVAGFDCCGGAVACSVAAWFRIPTISRLRLVLFSLAQLDIWSYRAGANRIWKWTMVSGIVIVPGSWLWSCSGWFCHRCVGCSVSWRCLVLLVLVLVLPIRWRFLADIPEVFQHGSGVCIL